MNDEVQERPTGAVRLQREEIRKLIQLEYDSIMANPPCRRKSDVVWCSVEALLYRYANIELGIYDYSLIDEIIWGTVEGMDDVCSSYRKGVLGSGKHDVQ
jgi:hypothetical protein